jgi:membrane associated rhomboid family serine protease
MRTLNQDIREKLSRLNVFEKIIVANLVVFIVSSIILKFQGFGLGLEWLSLSKSASALIYKPWTLLSYGFTHYSFSHLFFNMLVLYFFGRSFSNLFKADLGLKVFLLGILSGGLAFVAVYSLFPSGILTTAGPLVGASSGVRAIIIFLCVYLPNKELRFFTFRFPLKYIGIALVVFDLPGLFSQNSGGTVAHIGGYISGFYYARQFQKGIDMGQFIDKIVAYFSNSKSVLRTVHKKKKNNSYAGRKKEEFDRFTHQKQIDLILDKISKSGYESLSQAEKDFLFRAGK